MPRETIKKDASEKNNFGVTLCFVDPKYCNSFQILSSIFYIQTKSIEIYISYWMFWCAISLYIFTSSAVF